MARDSQVSVRPEPSDSPGRVLGRVILGLLGVASLVQAAGGSGRRGRLLWGALGGVALMKALSGVSRNRLVDLFLRPVFSVREELELNASANEVYRFWIDFDNYPRFMSFVEEVTVNSHGGLFWKLKGPAGGTFHWNAWLTAMDRDQRIAWRSDDGAVISHRGSVHIEELGPARSRVRIELSWSPPAGMLGSTLLRVLGYDPRQAFRGDLDRMKGMIESLSDEARQPRAS